MITELNAEKLTEIGARFRGDYQVEQGGYTLGIAAKEGTELAAPLPANYLADVNSAMNDVSNALKDKAMIAAESKSATAAQNQAFASAKIWRTRVMNRCRRAACMGKEMPSELIHINSAKTVPAVIGQMDAMTRLLEVNKAVLGSDIDALIKQGQDLTKALKEADASQEVKKLKDLPEAVRAFYQNKGSLYIGIKVINTAGRELHAAEPEKAAQYNLNILRRHAGVRKDSGKKGAAPVTKA